MLKRFACNFVAILLAHLQALLMCHYILVISVVDFVDIASLKSNLILRLFLSSAGWLCKQIFVKQKAQTLFLMVEKHEITGVPKGEASGTRLPPR